MMLERVGDYQDATIIIDDVSIFIRVFDDPDRKTEITIPEFGYSICIPSKIPDDIESFINDSVIKNYARDYR